MNKNLKIIRIPHGSNVWYRFRSTGLTEQDAKDFNCEQYEGGIGGSEIGRLLVPDKYDDPVWIFHRKIGTLPPKKEDNQSMFWGRELEKEIAEKWQYYSGEKDSYIENYKNNQIIRKCRNVNGYIINPKYPWLFASIDRLINVEGGINLITAETLKTEAILECKNMKYWTAEKWKDEFPIYFLAQVTQYMLILETDYAEIAMLIEGSRLEVEKVEFDQDLADRIIRISKAFWYDRVLPARKALHSKTIAELDDNTSESEKWGSKLDEYEPEPTNSEAYQKFLEERFVKERASILGSIEMFNVAKRDKAALALINKLKDERNLCQNRLKKTLTDNGAESLDFEGLGNVSWSEQKGKKSRRFSNDIKEKPTENRIEEEFNKLNLDY